MKRVDLDNQRQAEGTFSGSDSFMKLVLCDAIVYPKAGGQNKIGMSVVRGNSVVMLQARDKI